MPAIKVGNFTAHESSETGPPHLFRFRVTPWRNVTSPLLLIFPAAGMRPSPQRPTTMQTIQCPRCRHTFLSYAAECPECGLKRPRDTRSKWRLLAAVVTSGFALAATALMVMKITGQNEDPSLRSKATVKSRQPTTR